MKEQQLNEMLSILGILIGAVFIIEVIPVIIIGMFRDLDELKRLVEEFKRLRRENK